MKHIADVPVRSVKKALELLEMIALAPPAQKGISLSELAKRMQMLPNSTRNILKTMILCGFIGQNREGRYVTGAKISAMCRQNYFDAARLKKIERLLAEFSSSIEKYGKSLSAPISSVRITTGLLAK